MAEVIALLRGLGARAAAGGPMSEVPGVVWVALRDANLERALGRLHGIGYTESIDLVASPNDVNPRDRPQLTRWKGREVALLRVYEESDESLQMNAPGRRTFLLECGDGIIREIVGYRGGSGILEHRALPVADARLLVNLVTSHRGASLLDPFAGAGGVVLEANAKGLASFSIDRDSTLRFGLARISSRHVVADASALPFEAASFDAVATEPPYHASALDSIVASISEATRVTRDGGRIAYLVASEQTSAIRRAGEGAGLRLELAAPIDRKGLAVTCLCWTR